MRPISKRRALQILNKIYGINTFIIDKKPTGKQPKIITIPNIMFRDADKAEIILNYYINKSHICIIQEFILRLFNHEKKDGKVWFLSPEESALINIEKT